MAEKAPWYYVENNERKGPISLSELKKLASEGVVGEQTLVWKEGMQDWVKAEAVKGLISKPQAGFPKIDVGNAGSKPQPAAAPTIKTQSTPKVAVNPQPTPTVQPSPAPAANPEPIQPVASTPQVSATPQVNVGPAGTGAEVAPQEPVQNFAAPTESVAQTPRPVSRSPRDTGSLFAKIKFVGYPCLIAGFMLVLTGKGCDSLNTRWASRLAANAKLAEMKKDGDKVSPERLSDMRTAAQTARYNNQSWGFLNEMMFVLGSMVLTFGLLVVGIAGDASEKWICLIMLAIIMFSVYVGGIAWLSSIQGSMGPGLGF